MNILDIILLLCLIPVLIQGLRKGFISQAVAIVSLVLGGWLAYKFSSALSVWLAEWIQTSDQLLQIIAFIVIFIIVIIVLSLVGKLLESMVKIILLGWLNKLLGFIFALCKFVIFTGLIITMFEMLNSKFSLVKEEWLNSSFMYTWISDVSANIFPYLQNLIG